MNGSDEPTAVSKASGPLMNLFAGLRGKGVDGAVDVPMALMIPVVAAMLADGRVEDEELLQIRAVCEFSPVFHRNSSAQNDFLIAGAIRLIEDFGLEGACIRAREFLSMPLRETAFVHAVRVIFSDGYVGQLERAVVEQMIGWLEIDQERARMMVEVVSIMQHQATA